MDQLPNRPTFVSKVLLLQTTLKHWILQQSFHKWHVQGVDTRQTEMQQSTHLQFEITTLCVLGGSGWLRRRGVQHRA